MYRRLVTFALLVVTVAVTVLVIPLALAARDLVRAGNLTALADQARIVADSWEALARRNASAAPAAGTDSPGSDSESDGSSGSGSDGSSGSGSDDSSAVPRIQPPGEPGEYVLVLPDGSVVGGPVPAAASEVVASAARGRSGSVDTGSAGFAATPAVFADEQRAVVLAVADDSAMNLGLGTRLIALAGVCALLLVGAGLGAWLLARRTARPIRELAATADSIAAGDLSARAVPSQIAEVDDVGHALNRLATRVQELLDEERAAAAELAHQLRTPLTVLAADVDAVAEPDVRQRLSDDVLTLRRTTDEIITSARRTSREGLRASCDAVQVVAQRAEFWRVLAEYQDRPIEVTGTDSDPLPVRLTEYDLTTAIDVLLQNVFTHTDEGVALAISVAAASHGMVAVTVSDSGRGFDPGVPTSPRDGSTGLGLAIAGRIAEASGGSLDRGSTPEGGARVTLVLGPATL
jgi:signal transduction histidine kinase